MEVLLNNASNLLVPAHDGPHGEDEDEHDHEGALVPKVIAMCVLFTASTIVGLLPFKLSQWFKWTATGDAKAGRVVSSLLSFGGGVLLATTFLHLQPEVMEIIADLQHEGKLDEYKFNLAQLLMCCGFFIIFLIEELVHWYIDASAKRHTDTGAFERGIHARESVLLKRKKADLRNGSISTAELIDDNQQDVEKSAGTSEQANNNVIVAKVQNHDHHNHSHLPISADSSLVTNLKGLLIVLALSIHELLEGLALGLEHTSEGAYYFFGAVAAHKLVIAFCIGVELVAIRTKLWLSVVYVLTFAIVSPIGIGIGILLSETDNSDTFAVPSVILQGLASGTLLYVIFFEVLSKERSGLIQYAAVVLGFFIMFGLQYLTGHEHSHGGGHDHDDHGHNHDSHSHDHEEHENLAQTLLEGAKQQLFGSATN